MQCYFFFFMYLFVGVPPGMQKVMVKGLARDDKSLKEAGITKGSKVMVVGSTLNDVLAVSGASTAVIINSTIISVHMSSDSSIPSRLQVKKSRRRQQTKNLYHSRRFTGKY